MRLIDADAYIENNECCGYLDEISVKRFNELTPTVDAVERKKGKWERRWSYLRCSNCWFRTPANGKRFNFCPNCGAEMEDENNER